MWVPKICELIAQHDLHRSQPIFTVLHDEYLINCK